MTSGELLPRSCRRLPVIRAVSNINRSDAASSRISDATISSMRFCELDNEHLRDILYDAVSVAGAVLGYVLNPDSYNPGPIGRSDLAAHGRALTGMQINSVYPRIRWAHGAHKNRIIIL